MNSAGKLVELAADPITMDSSGPRPRSRRFAVVGLPGLVLACLLPAGCGATRTPPPARSTPSDEQAQAEADATGVPQGVAATGSSAATSTERTGPPPESTASTTATAAAQRSNGAAEPLVLAPVGPEDARRGKTIAGGGIISEPLRQNFLIRHRIAFLNLQNTEKLYKASEGRMPESHEEYMTEIVEKGGIQLPELDPGWDYYYDASDQTLKKRKVQ